MNDLVLDKLIDTPKVVCMQDCPMLNALGFCNLYRRHRNYIVKCEWKDGPIQAPRSYWKTYVRTNS